MPYLPFFGDINLIREYVNRVYEYYTTHIPQFYVNYYNLDQVNSNVEFDQSLTDINLDYHQIRYNLYYKYPMFYSDYPTSRFQSDGTTPAVSNEQFQLTMVVLHPEIEPTVGDKIAITTFADKLITRECEDVFTVVEVEYPTNQRYPVGVVRLTIRRDQDFGGEQTILDTNITRSLYFVDAYKIFVTPASYNEFLQLVLLAENVQFEIDSRWYNDVLSNQNLNNIKEFIDKLREIIEQILFTSPEISFSGIFKNIFYSDFAPIDNSIDLLQLNFTPMSDIEIRDAKRYFPDIYKFDTHYKLDPVGGTITFGLPEFLNYLNTSTLPAFGDLTAYSGNLDTLSTIELFQLLVLIDLYIRSMAV